jgi:hypothetical protein
MKVMGYYSADHALKNTRLSKLVDVMSKTGLYWNIFTNDTFQKTMAQGWKATNEAILTFTEYDNKNQTITYKIEEDTQFYLDSPSITDLKLLEGQLEALTGLHAQGTEIIRKDHKIYKYKFTKKPQKTRTPLIKKETAEKIQDQLIDQIIKNEPTGRKKLEDKVHLSGEQIITYFMTHQTQGHQIIEKYAGIKTGQKIREKIKNPKELRKILQQQKIAILDQKNNIKESAYTAGTKNTPNLNTYLKNIIQETHCISQGHEYCVLRVE